MGQQLKNIELLSATAKRLKGLRVEKQLSQETVFYDTSIHIARIETGKLNISISTLNAICEYYQVSLAEFFSIGFEIS